MVTLPVSHSPEFAEIWQLFKNTEAQLRETASRFKETDARLATQRAETDARLAAQRAETDVRLAAQRTETDARIAAQNEEVTKQFKETDLKLRRLEGLMGVQWGRMIESLVKPSALKLFKARGIAVEYVYERMSHRVGGETMELDLFLEDTTTALVVEIKSSCHVADVNDVLGDLARFPTFFPKYAGYQIYGAVAGLDFPGDSDRYAHKKGLFVLRLSGDDLVEIANPMDFQPRDFGAIQK